MAIKIDEDNRVVVYENEPEEARSLFPNLQEGGGSGVQDVKIDGTSIVDAQGVAEIPLASDSVFGAVKVGTGMKIIASDNSLRISTANEDQAKAGTESYYAVTPLIQHASVFYGLAKAAGDTTQAVSSNNVGQYTDSAKNAIKTMLGISDYYERVTPLYIVWDSDTSSYVVYSPQGTTLDMPSINPLLRLITAEGDNMSNFVEFSLIKSETTDPDYETTFNPVTVLTFRSLEPTWFNKIVTITYEWYMPFEESTISVSTLS